MPKAGQKAFSQWGRPCPAGQAVARPGAVHPPCLSEVIGVGVSSLRQSHTFNLHVPPGWDWLPQHPGCLPAILFFAQESLRVLGSGLAPAVPAPRKSGALCGAWWEGAGGPVFSRSRAQVPRYLAKPEPASDAPLTHSARLRATRVNPTLDIPGRVPFCGMPLGSMVGLSWRAGVSPLCYVRRWSSQGPDRTQSATGARGAPGLSQAWQMAGHRGMERRADHCWPGWAHRGDHGVAVVCVAPFLTRLGQALAGAAARWGRQLGCGRPFLPTCRKGQRWARQAPPHVTPTWSSRPHTAASPGPRSSGFLEDGGRLASLTRVGRGHQGVTAGPEEFQ